MWTSAACSAPALPERWTDRYCRHHTVYTVYITVTYAYIALVCSVPYLYTMIMYTASACVCSDGGIPWSVPDLRAGAALPQHHAALYLVAVSAPALHD